MPKVYRISGKRADIIEGLPEKYRKAFNSDKDKIKSREAIKKDIGRQTTILANDDDRQVCAHVMACHSGNYAQGNFTGYSNTAELMIKDLITQRVMNKKMNVIANAVDSVSFGYISKDDSFNGFCFAYSKQDPSLWMMSQVKHANDPDKCTISITYSEAMYKHITANKNTGGLGHTFPDSIKPTAVKTAQKKLSELDEELTGYFEKPKLALSLESLLNDDGSAIDDNGNMSKAFNALLSSYNIIKDMAYKEEKAQLINLKNLYNNNLQDDDTSSSLDLKIWGSLKALKLDDDKIEEALDLIGNNLDFARFITHAMSMDNNKLDIDPLKSLIKHCLEHQHELTKGYVNNLAKYYTLTLFIKSQDIDYNLEISELNNNSYIDTSLNAVIKKACQEDKPNYPTVATLLKNFTKYQGSDQDKKRYLKGAEVIEQTSKHTFNDSMLNGKTIAGAKNDIIEKTCVLTVKPNCDNNKILLNDYKQLARKRCVPKVVAGVMLIFAGLVVASAGVIAGAALSATGAGTAAALPVWGGGLALGLSLFSLGAKFVNDEIKPSDAQVAMDDFNNTIQNKQ